MNSPVRSTMYRQFDQFLVWVLIVAVVFALIEWFAAWLLTSVALGIVGTTTAGFGLMCAVARRIVRKQKLYEGVGLVCAGFMIAPLLYMAAMPELLATCVFFVVAAGSLPLLFQSWRLFMLSGAGTVLSSVILVVLSHLPPIAPQAHPTVSLLLRDATLPVCTVLIVLLFYFIWQNLVANIQHLEHSNHAFHTLQATLEQQVVERTSALREALSTVESQAEQQGRLLAENAQQRHVIRSLTIPVLPVSADTLVVPLIGDVDVERLHDLQAQVLHAVSTTAARWVVLDITGVPGLDVGSGRGLHQVMQATRLLGADLLLVGIRPDVAQTMVSLDIQLGDLQTETTLQQALATIQQRTVSRSQRSLIA